MARAGTQEAAAQLLADDAVFAPVCRGDRGAHSGLGVSGTAWMGQGVSEGGLMKHGNGSWGCRYGAWGTSC